MTYTQNSGCPHGCGVDHKGHREVPCPHGCGIDHRKPKGFTTTITQEYWNMKLEDHECSGHFWEYKSRTEHWERLRSLKPPCPGVFLVGKEPHLVEVQQIFIAKTYGIPVKYEKAITTEKCWCIKCVIV